MKSALSKKNIVIFIVIAAIIIIGVILRNTYLKQETYDGLAMGNGRLEATEIDISTKLAGRIKDIQVDEGDFVKAGQVLAHMQIDVLEAQLAEAQAQYNRSLTAKSSAYAEIKLRESNVEAAKATVIQRKSEFDAADKRFLRTEELVKRNAISRQQLDDDKAAMRSSEAAILAAQAQVAAAQAAVEAAKSQAIGAEAAVKAAQATINRIQADIDDSQLVAPRDGRVQYRIAQPGEVLGAGGKILNLIDLSDVYMTFFLPEAEAGRLTIGSEAHIIIDALPKYVIPARVTFVASAAQFTPKTVETANERQKLMFRVKAQIDKELLQKYIELVKTGVPGVVWIKTSPDAQWPDKLMVNVSL